MHSMHAVHCNAQLAEMLGCFAQISGCFAKKYRAILKKCWAFACKAMHFLKKQLMPLFYYVLVPGTISPEQLLQKSHIHTQRSPTFHFHKRAIYYKIFCNHVFLRGTSYVPRKQTLLRTSQENIVNFFLIHGSFTEMNHVFLRGTSTIVLKSRLYTIFF